MILSKKQLENRKYYLKNKEKIKAISKKYYWDNHEQERQKNKQWIRKNRYKRAIYQSNYIQTKKAKKARYKYMSKYLKDHPGRRYAWDKAQQIPKKPCIVCGKLEVHRHHPNYSNPLEVIFLCPLHHEEIHNNANTFRIENDKISI